MDPIVWNANLETGHFVVDMQHQAMFKAFNQLLEAMNRGKGRDEIRKTLLFLKDYTKRHFTMEESLMLRTQYLDLDHHRALHGGFMEKLADLADRNERGASVTIAVMLFMKEWLLDHIQIEDRRLAQHLAELEVHEQEPDMGVEELGET